VDGIPAARRIEAHGLTGASVDNTVALVQAYLHVTGYFTVAEYPIVAVNRRGEARGVTDIDLMAWRFPGAGGRARLPGGRGAIGEAVQRSDPALACPSHRPDMLIAEVKRGQARFNRAMRDPLVLATALARFGCCTPDDAEAVARQLARSGSADTHCGHQVRLVAFGMQSQGERVPGGHSVSLANVVGFLRQWLRENWGELHGVKFCNPALELLAMLERVEPPVRKGRR
jgi:hypothetical protein